MQVNNKKEIHPFLLPADFSSCGAERVIIAANCTKMKIIYTTKFSVCIKYSWVFRFLCLLLVEGWRIVWWWSMMDVWMARRWDGKVKQIKGKAGGYLKWRRHLVSNIEESAAYKICTLFLYRQNITKYNSNPQKSLFNRNFRTDVSVKRRKWLFPP